MKYSTFLLLAFMISGVCAKTLVVSKADITLTIDPAFTEIYSTIQSAVSKARAGDTVLVTPGVYPERVVFQNSGQAGMPITVRALQPGVVVDGNGLDFRGKDDGLFQINNVHYIEIVGFNFTNSKASGISICKSSSYINIDSNTFNGDFGWSPIKLCFNSDSNFIQIIANKINRTVPHLCPWGSRRSCWAEMISISKGKNVYIYNNFISSNELGEGIDVKDDSAFVVIKNNTIKNTSSHSIYLDARGVVRKVSILDNLVIFSKNAGIALALEELSHDAAVISNVTIRGNVIYGAKTFSIGIGWYTKTGLSGKVGVIDNIHISRNTIYDHSGKGVIVGCNHAYSEVVSDYYVGNVVFDENHFFGGDLISSCLQNNFLKSCSPGSNGCSVSKYTKNSVDTNIDIELVEVNSNRLKPRVGVLSDVAEIDSAHFCKTIVTDRFLAGFSPSCF